MNQLAKDAPTGSWPTVEAALAADELVLWTGRPRARHCLMGFGPSVPRSRVGRVAERLVPLSFMAFGFALFGTLATFAALQVRLDVRHQHVGWWTAAVALAGVSAALAAVLVVTAGPISGYRRARHSRYLLTDRRAIVAELDGNGRAAVRSFPYGRLTGPGRVELTRCRPDATGDLLFHPSAEAPAELPDEALVPTDVGFVAIPEARTVERLLRQRIDAATVQSSGYRS